MKEVVLKDQLKKKAVLDQIDESKNQVQQKVNNLKVALDLKRTQPGGPDAPATPVVNSQSLKPRIGTQEFARMNEDYRKAEMNYKLAEQRVQLLQARREKIDALEPTAQEFQAYFDRDP